MFFDSVALSKNSWHFKLQRWMFNDVPYTMNFCPYFWLTIFCVFAAPFKGLYVGLKYSAMGILYAAVVPVMLVVEGFRLLGEFVDDRFFTPYVNKRTEIIGKPMSDEEAFNIALVLFTEDHIARFEYFDDRDWYPGLTDKNQKLLARWRAWQRATGAAWKNKMALIYAKRELQRAEEEKLRKELAKLKREKDRKRQQFFQSIIKYTKYLLILGIGIPMTYLIYGFGLLYLVIKEHWAEVSGFFAALWHGIMAAGPWVLLGLVGIIVVSIFIYLLIKAAKSAIESTPARKTGEAVGFIGASMKSFKKNHCPAIVWDD